MVERRTGKGLGPQTRVLRFVGQYRKLGWPSAYFEVAYSSRDLDKLDFKRLVIGRSLFESAYC